MLKKNILTGLFLILVLVVINSCEDSLTTIGNKLLPDEDGMSFKVDTIEGIKFKTVPSSVFETRNMVSPLLGHYKDEIIGETKSVVVTQMHNFTGINAFPSDAVLTDANVVLYFNNFFGDTMAMQSTYKFTVYELDKNGDKPGFTIDSTVYKSNVNYTDFFNRTELASIELDFNEIDTINGMYYVTIPVPESYYKKIKLLQDQLIMDYKKDTVFGSDTVTFNDMITIDSIFNERAAGLAFHCDIVNTDKRAGALFKLVTTSGSRFEINFNYNDTSNGSFYYTFYLGEKYSTLYHLNKYRPLNNYSFYQNDYSNSEVQEFIGSESDSLCFVQSVSGLNTEIIIPELSSSIIGQEENVIINKAELKIDKVPDYKIPEGLSSGYLWASVLDDYRSDLSANYFNSSFFKEVSGISGNTFYLNIPHIIQHFVDNKNENKFLLLPAMLLQNDNDSQGYFLYNNNSYKYQILDPSSAKLIITYSIP